jgi:diamine N-acetyltransferase
MRPLADTAPAYSIREMQPADVASVADLAARIWHENYVPDIVSAAQIDYMLANFCSPAAMVAKVKEKNQRFWLVREGEKLAGYIAVEPQGPDAWFIDKLYVDTKLQRSGLGKLLLSYVIREHRPKTLSLRVNRKNVRAVNFYFKHGFTIERLDVRDIGGGFVMDDFIMKRTLP